MVSNRSGPPRAAVVLISALAMAPAARASDAEVERLQKALESTQQELSATKGELAATRGALADLAQRVDAIQRAAPAAASEVRGTARLAPVNADNPAISFVVDTLAFTDTNDSDRDIGYPNGAGFALRNAELFLSAPIDPFLRGYASINGSSDGKFDVEEAALVTTALPGNLTVKGGRFFADVGRFPHWHDEALPFVDRPPSIERLIGGESQAEGAEVSWLAPFGPFFQLTGGVYNTVGAANTQTANEFGYPGRRSFDELSYLVRPQTYFDLTDTFNAEIGGTFLAVPQNHDRSLYGVDLTLRHQPGTGGFYQGLVWGTEWYWNDERFGQRDDLGNVLGTVRDVRQGGYSYVEAFFDRRYSAGLRFDYSEAIEGLIDRERTTSAFVTWQPSEFQRLRLQFDTTSGDQPSNQRFTLQWTAFIGSHSHGFAQR